MTGCTVTLHPTSLVPGHVTRAVGHKEPQVIDLPEEVRLLILLAHDLDVMEVEATQHSEDCWTVYCFTRKHGLRIWLAHLSLDGRWTLSPAY